MRKATRKTKNLLDILHIGSSIGWLGGGFMMLTINIAGLLTADPQLRHAAHEIAHVLDRWPLTALSVTALVTGALLGLKTKWGLVRYWWVTIKLVLTSVLLVTTPILVGGWALDAVDRSGRPGVLADSAYLVDRAELLGASVSIISLLTFMLVLSVVKPWKRIRQRTYLKRVEASGQRDHGKAHGDGLPSTRTAVDRT
ncbi:hypothetical protein GCM10009765_27760 [Fodinicola feengrottensis]|uniref:DUF2269 domain-containing protein n=1 Tax=Fodinicola feengrottensis TaxID=435914 RepID=A0ABN2GU48_9ACTN